ncbi:helix-turn-helix domain-containing protein [Chryseolinea sp. H1M3-3]|uniref:helix-turn-helix domain-containing protein n=1 Tax=Chryseolinea sp. H1M3-3 TaxID=3034144 RepID=UPI0023EC1C63|nr:helix-turn-helix domain-containing protein [Chryseolinea sp. H1M3-3]
MDKISIAKKIVHYRKQKGMTQEVLAEMTGLNVRTVQRIEAGEVDPRLYTLKSIADALQVNLEELLPEPTQHELNQLAVLHITPIGFFLFPVIGNVLLPFIFWMMKREEINGINKHGKDILNGQLTYSILMSFLFGIQIVLALTAIFLPGDPMLIKLLMNFPVLIVVGMVLAVLVFGIFPAINAIKVYNGKEPWKYPLKINFFK